MRIALALVALGLVAASGLSAVTENSQRIVGGSETTIEQYPFGAVILYSFLTVTYNQICGGTILNTRSILTAGHCVHRVFTIRLRIRTGSTMAHSGGVVHNTAQVIVHPSYNMPWPWDNDIAILRSSSIIDPNDLQRPGIIAGPSYNLADNQPVWAIGWGRTCNDCDSSEQLRHVQVRVVNQNTCRTRYHEDDKFVTDNMLCIGWLDVDNRNQCWGDSGGPVLHNNVVVGVGSWGRNCDQSRYPHVNARVSRYTAWIQANA